jgi:hypothetical protein
MTLRIETPLCAVQCTGDGLLKIEPKSDPEPENLCKEKKLVGLSHNIIWFSSLLDVSSHKYSHLHTNQNFQGKDKFFSKRKIVLTSRKV